MDLRITEPSRVYLPNDSEEMKRFLSFVDRSVGFQIQKMKRNFRWANSDPDSFQERIDALKAEQNRTLLSYTEDGVPYTYSGLVNDLINRFGFSVQNDIEYPKPQIIPYDKVPHAPRYYQKAAAEALLAARHGTIELPTGSGKSLVILMLCKALGLKTLIMTPLGSITEQLYKDFLEHFGRKYVGKYGEGSKNSSKLFTIATAQSLTRIEPGSEAWENLSQVQVFISDECHTTPAETFQKVCLELAAKAPYRFFVSATNMRTDGSEMILRGITGPLVYSKDFKDLVREGFLAQPKFKIFSVPTYGSPNKEDVKSETRQQLYNNPYVHKIAADIATHSVRAGRPTLIIIEEFKQLNHLIGHLMVPFQFVHGGLTAEHKKFIPSEYWDCDRDKLIKDFNEGRIMCLVGTSAVATGVDLKPTQALIYLQGGLSEIKVKQSVGRGTRIFPGKTDCWVVDFKIRGSRSMERHAEARKQIYLSMGEVAEH